MDREQSGLWLTISCTWSKIIIIFVNNLDKHAWGYISYWTSNKERILFLLASPACEGKGRVHPLFDHYAYSVSRYSSIDNHASLRAVGQSSCNNSKLKVNETIKSFLWSTPATMNFTRLQRPRVIIATFGAGYWRNMMHDWLGAISEWLNANNACDVHCPGWLHIGMSR